MSTTFCLSVRTECASDDNTTRTDFSHYFRSLAEVVLNTLHLTYKQASKSITTHGWWAEVGLVVSRYLLYGVAQAFLPGVARACAARRRPRRNAPAGEFGCTRQG